MLFNFFLSVIILKQIFNSISVEWSPSTWSSSQFSDFSLPHPLIHSLCLPYLRRAISKCASPALMLLFESSFAIILPSSTLFPLLFSFFPLLAILLSNSLHLPSFSSFHLSHYVFHQLPFPLPFAFRMHAYYLFSLWSKLQGKLPSEFEWHSYLAGKMVLKQNTSQTCEVLIKPYFPHHQKASETLWTSPRVLTRRKSEVFFTRTR